MQRHISNKTSNHQVFGKPVWRCYSGASDRSTRNCRSVPRAVEPFTSIALALENMSAAQSVISSPRDAAALYFATFDAGGGAMDDRDWDEAANGAFFRNFFSGMS